MLILKEKTKNCSAFNIRRRICFGFPMGNIKNSYFLFGDAGGAETPHTSPVKHNAVLK